MALIEKDLFGNVRDKVKVSIERIKTFEPPEGYWVAMSGGKDSQVVMELVKKSGVKFEAHFALTSVDPPEVISFVKKYYPEVILDKPPLTMFQLILKKKMPPLRMVRYCCAELKERYGQGRFVITGIRWEESIQRSKRKMMHHCLKDKRKMYLHPIIDWSGKDVWEYIKGNNLPYCNLYDEGYKRIGCILCPMQKKSEKLKDIKRFPNFVKAYIHTFDKMIKAYPVENPNFKNGQERFDRWILDFRKDYNETWLPFDN